MRVSGQLATRRRGSRRLTERQIGELYRLYLEGASIAALARAEWQRAGYASPDSAATSLRLLFGRRDLTVRPTGRGRKAAARLGEEELRALHERHLRGRISAAELARRHWREWGYPSSEAARRGLLEGLRELELPVEHFMPSRLPPAQAAALLEPAREGGATVAEIARAHWQRLGYASEQAAAAALRREHARARGGRPRRARLTDEQLQAIGVLLNANRPLQEIVDVGWRAWGYPSRRHAMRSLRLRLQRRLLLPAEKPLHPPPRWLRERCAALTREGTRCRNPAQLQGRCLVHSAPAATVQAAS